jgi:hypothetical protein
MASGSGSTEPAPQEDLSQSFGDLRSPMPGGGGFDPAMEEIGRRYLELMDERY